MPEMSSLLACMLLLSPAESVTFTHDVLPILTAAGCNSGACHGALAGKGGLKLSLRGYDPEADYFALTRQAGGRRIDPFAAEESLLLQKPTGRVKHGGGRRLEADSEDHELLRRWIAAGAPGPGSHEPKLLRLEVEPKQREMKPNDVFRPTIHAVYSDQRRRDVSRWVRLGSTDENVATVAEGQVTGRGHGQAAITVVFADQVAMIPVVAPFPNPPPAKSSLIRHNFIDDSVNAKLVALRLPPAPLCTDAEFIRRAYLDVTGTLPTPEESRAFVSDTARDKRAKLIDRLLLSAEHVDYWTHKWGDLFLVSSRSLSQPAVWAYHRFLRDSVERNVPWDQFARQVLTAQGSNLRNGAVNYFVLHKDPAEVAETTAVTFLGMSLACAKCHNHPLEKWTQDDYWKYANFFGRVGLESGERGETLAKPLPRGEVLHLRRGVSLPPTPPGGSPLPDEFDRRAAFARWLTSPKNPWFAKAVINRVWKHYLGRGLIEADDDLRDTNPPTNVELLTALEADFIASGYDLRHLQRQILNSAAYQRSSTPAPGAEEDDRYFSHFLVKRLPAEVILDAYSQVTGVPTQFGEVTSGGTGGVMKIEDYPAGTRALQLPDTKIVSRFLDTFGRPEREVACACEREADATVAQALHLNNGATLNPKLRDPKSRPRQWLAEKLDNDTIIHRLYELALCRPPSDHERKKLADLLAESAAAGQPPEERLEDLFWAVLTSREFLFVR